MASDEWATASAMDFTLPSNRCACLPPSRSPRGIRTVHPQPGRPRRNRKKSPRRRYAPERSRPAHSPPSNPNKPPRRLGRRPDTASLIRAGGSRGIDGRGPAGGAGASSGESRAGDRPGSAVAHTAAAPAIAGAIPIAGKASSDHSSVAGIGAAMTGLADGHAAIGGPVAASCATQAAPAACCWWPEASRGRSKQLTATMDSLANGTTELSVPGIARQDEIGAMSCAVEVFRNNAIEVARVRSAEGTSPA